MPTISEFFGIIIRMYPTDHLPAHFHAFYQGYRLSVDIETGIIKGRFPPRALRLVQEWLELHRQELLVNWHKLQQGQDADRIEGLE